jgi:DNA-binding LytR/AlgR family response regulator
MKLRCLIVDDEPLARKGMEEYVSAVPFLELAGTASRAAEARGMLKAGDTDLLLLDIQMPEQTGLEFLRSLTDPPLVIITTAFDEFALQGYELDVVDYLVKPIPFERFVKAVTKAKDYMQYRKNPEKPGEDHLFVKSNGRLERVNLNEILFVEAMQNYIIIHRASGKLVVYMTLSSLEKQLPPDRFMRVHKSFVTSLGHVDTIDGHTLHIGKHHIPVSRSLRQEVTKRIIGKDQLRR